MSHMKCNIRCTLSNLFFYFAGIIFLFLAKTKYKLKGYSSPKPFDLGDADRCIEYDFDVVDKWLSFLKKYAGGNDSLAGKRVLELGPGSDLGVGIYLLSKGAEQYNAIDVNNLVELVDANFYARLFKILKEHNNHADLNWLAEELNKTRKGKSNKLNYICRKDFNISIAFENNTIDIVFSQAAFEHFENPDITITQLSSVVKPGGILITEIDLKTHSRWIRDKDPNNIYRYSKGLYDLFSFAGIPNRFRPYKYKELFERNGWENVWIKPLESLSRSNSPNTCIHLNKSFRDELNEMRALSIILCATKS